MHEGSSRYAKAATALAAVALAAAAWAPAAGAAQVRVSEQRFDLRAGNERGLLAEMRARGPLVEGRRSFARTRMQAHLRTRFSPRGGRCKVSGVSLRLNFTVLLPRARNLRRLPPRARKRWRAFVAHLRRHEARHRRIWLRCARRAEARIRTLSAADCATLRARTRKAWRASQRACDKAHEAFDAKERRAALRLPFIRAALAPQRRASR